MPATPEAVLKAVMRLQGQAGEIASKPDTDTIESLTPADDDCGIYDDRVLPQQVAHATDMTPPASEGQLFDEEPEAIENPNVSTARGPAHSE